MGAINPYKSIKHGLVYDGFTMVLPTLYNPLGHQAVTVWSSPPEAKHRRLGPGRVCGIRIPKRNATISMGISPQNNALYIYIYVTVPQKKLGS